MNYINPFWTTTIGLVTFSTLIIWELVWKGLALYQAGKKQQPLWFFFILIINSVGMLPIIYLLISRDKVPKKVKQKK